MEPQRPETRILVSPHNGANVFQNSLIEYVYLAPEQRFCDVLIICILFCFDMQVTLPSVAAILTTWQIQNEGISFCVFAPVLRVPLTCLSPLCFFPCSPQSGRLLPMGAFSPSLSNSGFFSERYLKGVPLTVLNAELFQSRHRIFITRRSFVIVFN